MDAKGRVSIPAPFRGVLSRDGFEGLFVTPAMDAEAMDCGGHALLRDFELLLASVPTVSDDWGSFAASLYGQSELLKIDGEGRIVMTDAMRVQAGITSTVTFVGMGRKFQLWEPERFRAYLAEAKDRVREARKHMGSHGTAAARPPSTAP